MAKLVRGTCRGVGNFGRLPDELLYHIISLLPFKDAVCTSLLSKRWRYLYASMSNLNLNVEQGGNIENLAGLVNVVNNLFQIRNKCLFDNFNLSESVSKHINPLHTQGWVQSVLWNGIRELDLTIPYTFVLPSSLFSCKTLEVLKLEMTSDNAFEPNYSRSEVPIKVSLPNLEVLHLVNLAFTDKESVNRLVSNCPVLEEFVLYLWEEDCKLNVSNSTLKHLDLRYVCPKRHSGTFDIVVNAPNIETLIYSADDVTSQTFVIGPALTQATYDLRVFGDRSHYFRCATNLIGSIKDIELLCINDQILTNLQEFNIPLPLFKNMRHLAIPSCGVGLKALPYLLARCESLEVLEFMDGCLWNPNPDDWIPLEEPRVSCLTSHLEIIEFFSFKPEDDQIEMVKYFLKSAKVLKSVEIHLCREDDVNLEIIKELQMLPRRSEECNVVIFPDSPLPRTRW